MFDGFDPYLLVIRLGFPCSIISHKIRVFMFDPLLISYLQLCSSPDKLPQKGRDLGFSPETSGGE
jgi:hypothetical protein